METLARHLVIRGRVQGVGYRAWAADEARMRGLEGWVRNRRDGSVEAVLAGPEAVVADMMAYCRRGPVSARVDAIDEAAASGDLLRLRGRERFAVLPTV
ncbi:MAG: acylphosphatase [Proteobacteria bacterium]|nr:MAG: acylphosphatase [Pseudomonadota bacterium]